MQNIYIMFYTRTLSHFYGPFHILICFVEKRSFIVWIGRTLISGHTTAANFQTNKPGNRKNSLPLTSFQNIPHTISKRLTLRSEKSPFQILLCMRLACGQHLWCKMKFSAWGAFQTAASSFETQTWFLPHAASCLWVPSNIFYRNPWTKTLLLKPTIIAVQRLPKERRRKADSFCPVILLICQQCRSAKLFFSNWKRNMDDLPNTTGHIWLSVWCLSAEKP